MYYIRKDQLKAAEKMQLLPVQLKVIQSEEVIAMVAYSPQSVSLN